MKKVLMVFGTRPEAIKMCPLVKEFEQRPGIQPVVCVTAQHRQMLDQALKSFDVTPDYDLNIMKQGQTLFDITQSTLSGVREVLDAAAPEVILVHGDTTSAFAGALAGFYAGIPVGHVEAGLRTYDRLSPYPEEFNRQAIDAMSAYLFAPTQRARANLIREGKGEKNVFVTGNTVIDAMQSTVNAAYSHPELAWAADSRLIFITAHRRESIGEDMRHMFKAIRRVLDENQTLKAVFPIHMNPEVRRLAAEVFSGCERIHIIEPLDAIACHNFEARCFLCLTDSGGIQEECPSFGKPVLVMRNVTERPEGVETGALKLVGTNEEAIYQSFTRLVNDSAEYSRMAGAENPFGDGGACKRIADVIQFGHCDEFGKAQDYVG